MIEPIGKSKLVYLVGVSKIGRGETLTSVILLDQKRNWEVCIQRVDKYRSVVFGGPVQVYRIDPRHITSKKNPIEEEKMFKHGKK